MSLKSITLPSVELKYTAEYIAAALWKYGVAKVGSITMMPYLKDDTVFNIAYINIDSWCDSENAFKLMNNLKDPLKENRIIHDLNLFWNVEINKHNSGDIDLYNFTRKFDTNFFSNNVDNPNPIFVN